MKTQYTQYTPIPLQVPRQLAIEILQSHGEMITTNPLVLEYKPIKAPRDCPNDEYYSTWYEITERINFVPGLKKMGSSKVTFRGCFHDMPWGVQTHMYVPMGVDLRNKWQVKGSQPGEPPEPRELGTGAPSSGLYLKEEITIKCNPLAVSFVKKEMKAAAQTMVERMLKKAELLDAGILQAMFEGGKLKTFNPADRTQTIPQGAVPLSPGPMSPGYAGTWRPVSMQDSMQRSASQASESHRQSYQSSNHPTNQSSNQLDTLSNHQPSYSVYNRETPNANGQIAHPEGKGFAVEMPGDYLYANESANQNRMGTSDRMSQVSSSNHSGDQRDSRWSFLSDERSYIGTSRPGSHPTSPVGETKTWTAELPVSGHKDYELNGPLQSSSLPSQSQTLQQPQPSRQQHCPPPPQSYPVQQYTHQAYNPQHYAKFAGNGYS